MAGKWICLKFNIKTCRKKQTVTYITNTINKLFEGDVLDLFIPKNIQDESVLQSERYVFVKCKDYFSHVPFLENHSSFCLVLNSIQDPSFLTDKEVKAFKKSSEGKSCVLSVGDLVKVNEGFLKGLYGIIIDEKKSECKVLFCLFSDRFVCKVNKLFLTNTGNKVDKQHWKTEKGESYQRLHGKHGKRRENRNKNHKRNSLSFI